MEPTIGERIEHRRLDEIHQCIRPGCSRRAKVALHVDRETRLAGQDFVPGEFVDLCPEDYGELLRAVVDAEARGDVPNPLDRFREWRP